MKTFSEKEYFNLCATDTVAQESHTNSVQLTNYDKRETEEIK